MHAQLDAGTFIVDGAKQRWIIDLRSEDYGLPGYFYYYGVKPQINAPRFCELLFCLLVEPGLQEDRLADFQERFNNHWVPNFGRRGAVAIYVWHVSDSRG